MVCWEGGGRGVLSTAREVGDKGRQVAACRILALSFYEAGDYVQSLKSSKEELAIAREELEAETEREAQCAVFWPGLICASEDTTEY